MKVKQKIPLLLLYKKGDKIKEFVNTYIQCQILRMVSIPLTTLRLN